jgi:muramidase (phage lysozyme)
MVDLATVGNQVVTSTAPTSAITPGVIEQQANQRAKALGQVADDLMDVSTKLAKNQAAEDLMNQKVTRNADGSVNVENPVSAPLIFGDAGKAFTDAVKVGTIAQHGNSLSQDFADLHTKYPTDPAAFKAAAQAHLDKTAQTVTGPIGEAVQAEGQQLLTQHFNAITSTAATNNIENQKKSITSQIEDQKNTAIALARQGGTDTPEFKQAVTKMNLSYDALGTNPLFKTPQDQIDLEKKNTAGLLQGEALVAHVDSTFNKRGKVEAQKALEEGILNNPNLREVDRSRLYTQGLSRLAYLTADAKINIDANRAITTEFETNLANGKVKAEDPAVGLAIKRATDIGDTEGAQRITAAAAVQQHMRAVNPLPDAIKAEVLGVPTGAVNTAIPAEGRALLNTIAATESAGRYNVRYGGNTPKTFQDYGDHPRVAEPITSGPDVGKSSSAAGRYQFVAPTWDAQKAKLGLKDFSPENQDLAAWDLAQTEYKNKTGKDLLTTLKSGQTADVLPTLSGQWSSLPGGRQPAGRFMAPSANGGAGFTAEDVQRNPFLLSAYVRTLAADPELRVQAAKQSAEAIGKALDNGILPSPAAVAEVNQAAALYPEKMGKTADEMNGRLQGQKIAQLPQEQQAQVTEAYKRATDGQDVHHINVAAAALDQVTKSNKNMDEHPYDEAARRGWTQPAAPIDPAQPDGIAPALVQRASLSARIGGMNHTPNPPLLDKDEVPKLQTALQGPQGPAVLGSIAQALKPQEMQTLLEETAFRDSVTGMSRSGDPAKMNAAYSFMDGLQKQNPLQFEKQFPDGLKDLRAWQSNLAFYPPDEAAKRLMQAYDPALVSGRKAANETADDALKNVSPDKVVSKFSTGFGPIGTGARAPVSDMAGAASGALKADYDLNYREGFIRTGDAGAADKFAMEKLNLKYAVSPTNGNRVMANAPERYYPAIAGSYDWMAKQLDDAVGAAAGVAGAVMRSRALSGGESDEGISETELRGERQYTAPRALVADEQTDRDIANKKPPSYQVMLQDPNGRWSAMTAPPVSEANLQAADAAMKLTPQEKALYQRHLTNLTGPGGVDNPDGSRSTLFQTTVEHDGKFYTIPTVYDGKILWDKNAPDKAAAAVAKTAQIGWDKFPSYKTEDQAEARYQQMHTFMEKDTQIYRASGTLQRFRFDPTGPYQERADNAERMRTAQSFDNAGRVQP